MQDFFVDNLWPGLVAWAVLYVSDYTLTIVCARLYRAHVHEIIVFEGSYEITPYYQRDVNELRLVSRRFVLMLAVTLTLLAVQWRLATEALPQAYTFTLGAMICLQLAIHTRHLRNLFMFRAIIEGDGIRGRIDYSRRTMLRMSALEMAVFSGLYSVVALFTGSAFAFGGAASCLSVAVSHWKLARKQTPSARAVDATASHAT